MQQRESQSSLFRTPATSPEIIYRLDFHQSQLLVTTNRSLALYNLINKKQVWAMETNAWIGVILKETGYIAWVGMNDRKTISIIEIASGKTTAKIALTYDIEYIKSSRGCIAVASLTHLSVLHFPTLKPIYHSAVGNSISLVFDISFEGLVIVHSGEDKGVVQLKNFTAQRKERDRVGQNSKMTKTASYKNMPRQNRQESNALSARSNIQSSNAIPHHSIAAHQEHIACLALSPNGLRFVSASKKGTVLRVFSSVTAERLSEFRMSFDIGRVGDMRFDVDGGLLGCINQSNIINLFNVQMSEEEEICQSTRKGYQIYQQQNPKSIFSFLSYFHENLANQYPFASFKLVKPQVTAQEFKINEQKSKQFKQSEKEKSNQQIPQQVHQEEIEFGSIVSDVKNTSSNVIDPAFLKTDRNINRSVSPQRPNFRRQSSSKPHRQSGSLMNLMRTTNAPQALPIQPRPYYPHCFRLHISTNSSIWVVKGHYLYELKYDPFHGGQMLQVQAIELEEVRKWQK